MRRMERMGRNYSAEHGSMVYSILCEQLDAALGDGYELIDLGGGRGARIMGRLIILSDMATMSI